MAKTGMIRARMEPGLKEEVEGIFSELGLSITEAITLFYRMTKLHRGLPFPVKIPNEMTMETFRKTDEGKELVDCESAEDMFDKLEI